MKDYEIKYLEQSDNFECTLDNSGIYCLINRVNWQGTHKEYAGYVIHVRVDIMSNTHNPLITFCGPAEVIIKHVIQWIEQNDYPVSLQHVSYIASRIMKANYCERLIQD